MARVLLLVCFLSSTAAFADGPDFSRGAVMLGLHYGYGLWGFDRAQLSSQVGAPNADAFLGTTPNAQAAAVRLGYNVLGHATAEAVLTATGWNLTEVTRGGAGFLIGALRWHPLMLVFPEGPRKVPFDASVFFGAGYGIVGQARGMDGAALTAGFDIEYYISRGVGFSFFARDFFPLWNSFYLDYDNRAVPGNTIAMPGGSGGSFISFGLALNLRFET